MGFSGEAYCDQSETPPDFVSAIAPGYNASSLLAGPGTLGSIKRSLVGSFEESLLSGRITRAAPAFQVRSCSVISSSTAMQSLQCSEGFGEIVYSHPQKQPASGGSFDQMLFEQLYVGQFQLFKILEMRSWSLNAAPLSTWLVHVALFWPLSEKWRHV